MSFEEVDPDDGVEPLVLLLSDTSFFLFLVVVVMGADEDETLTALVAVVLAAGVVRCFSTFLALS